MVGKLGSDPKGKIAKAILASLRATVLRRGSCQTFFYLTRICSGGKQVLGSEVSVKKLVELLEATTVVSRLFLFNGNVFF